jgi:hypothetical protein
MAFKKVAASGPRRHKKHALRMRNGDLSIFVSGMPIRPLLIELQLLVDDGGKCPTRSFQATICRNRKGHIWSDLEGQLISQIRQIKAKNTFGGEIVVPRPSASASLTTGRRQKEAHTSARGEQREFVTSLPSLNER